MAKDFRSLKIWQNGYELLMKVYDMTSKYPKDEKYALTSQSRRSANGVIASIAEAHGRYYYKDKTRVLYVGRGECHETQSHLSVAAGRGYIDDEQFKKMDKKYNGLAKGINSYINSLNKNTD